MPGPASNLLCLDRVLATTSAPAVTAMQRSPSYAALGASATNWFELGAGYQGAWLDQIDWMIDAYGGLRDIRSFVQSWDSGSATVNRIKRSIERGIGMIERVSQTINLGMASAGDLYASPSFEVPMQSARRYRPQYWPLSDTLRYQATGALAETLSQRAGNQQQHAFAAGFRCHYATQVVGNAFVNNVVGGPRRSRPQLWDTARMHIDAYLWHVDGNDINTAHLEHRYPQHLSATFIDYLTTSIDIAHAGLQRPGIPDPQEALERFRRVIGFWTGLAHMDAPAVPTYSFQNEIREAGREAWSYVERTYDRIREAVNGSNGSSPFGGGRPSWEAFEDWVKSLLEGLGDFFRTLLTIIDHLVAGVADVVLTTLLDPVIYDIEVKVYSVWSAIRYAMGVLGFVYPERNLLGLRQAWYQAIYPSGGAAFDGKIGNIGLPTIAIDNLRSALDSAMPYPHTQLDGATSLAIGLAGALAPGGALPLAPLGTYFQPGTEAPGTTASPFPGHYATAFLAGQSPAADLSPWFDAPRPEATEQATATHGGGLGSAVELARRLLDRSSMPDLNLAADRGYGHRCWQASGRGNPLRNPPISATYPA